MRTPLLSLALLSTALHAQSVQWLRADPIEYALNPDLPTHVVCASDEDHVYAARTHSLTYLYNSVFGGVNVERYDANGQTVWSLPIGDSVLVEAIASNAEGDVIVGGRFFRAVHLGGSDRIDNLFGTEFPESFLFALNAEGELLWHRNVSPPLFDEKDIACITFDNLGRAWYAGSDFFHSWIARLDDNGNEVEVRELIDSKTIGSISFDPWGGMYISGSASNPGITMNGTFFQVEPQYNFFVARFTADGQAQWLRTAEDITFQRPRVVADHSGHAYLIGSPFDSLSWGDIHFHGPEWNSTFFLTRVDSMGHFDRGFQPPLGVPFAGQFEIGHGETIGVDDNDGVYVLGTVSGKIEWGNDVVTDNGSNQSRATTLLYLDAAGVPQWQLHSDSEGYDVPQGISVLPDGTCHLGIQAQNEFTIDGHTVDAGDQNGMVVVRIASSTTGIADQATTAADVMAFPSPFVHAFQVDAPVDRSRPFTVRVMDATGRAVATSTSLRDLGASLRSGTYLVDVAQGAQHWRTRVVKQ